MTGYDIAHANLDRKSEYTKKVELYRIDAHPSIGSNFLRFFT